MSRRPQNGPSFTKRRLTRSQIERSRIEAENEAKRKAGLDPKYKNVTAWDNHSDTVRRLSQIHSGYIPSSTPIDKRLLVRRKETRAPETIVVVSPDRPASSDEGNTGPLSKPDRKRPAGFMKSDFYLANG